MVDTMATDLTNTSTPITAAGDYEFRTVPGNMYTVDLSHVSGTGTITIKKASGDAYRNDADSADLAVTEASTVTGYDVRATGRKITLTAEAGFAGSFDHSVINLGVRA